MEFEYAGSVLVEEADTLWKLDWYKYTYTVTKTFA